jgi:hypothetical protein
VSPGQFINWELWSAMDGGNDWVEAGLTYGYLYDNTHGNNFDWFWADQRPNGGGYHEHFISAGWSKTWANVAIYDLGGGSWSVQRNGTQEGVSTNNSTSPADYSAAGAETTVSSNNINANNNNYQYRTPGGGWTGADPSTFSLQAPFGGNSYAGSITGAASHVWSNKCTPPGASAPAPGSPPRLAAIVHTARHLAALNGESNPTGIRYVTTTRAKANGLFRAVVNSNQAVYVIQMHGHFNGATASHPHGSPTPHGTILTVTIDAATGQITDWGLSSEAAPLNRLGAVRTIG